MKKINYILSCPFCTNIETRKLNFEHKSIETIVNVI